MANVNPHKETGDANPRLEPRRWCCLVGTPDHMAFKGQTRALSPKS